MEARLHKWGNSFGIRVPSNFLKELNLKENDLLEIKQVDEKIVITKSIKEDQKISLKKLFEQYHGENLAKDFSWDENVGKEIW